VAQFDRTVERDRASPSPVEVAEVAITELERGRATSVGHSALSRVAEGRILSQAAPVTRGRSGNSRPRRISSPDKS